MINYANFPKVELHRHLEGSFSPRILYKMAQKNGLDFPRDYEQFKTFLQFPKNAKPDFSLFLSKFFNGWYRSLDDVHDVVYYSMKEMFLNDRILYLELRFNPLHYALRCNFDPIDTLNVVLQALRQAVSERSIFVRYLLTFNRGVHNEQEMIKLLKGFQKKVNLSDVVGLDLAGDEVHFPPENFRNFFNYAYQEGFRVTIHAGEVTGPDQVRTCVLENHALRIGHGIAVIKDPELCEIIKERGTLFEICILSNYQTGACIDMANHPIKRLLREGVHVCLNSDDPTVQGSELYNEYCVAHEVVQLSLKELRDLNIYAIEGAFLSTTEKKTLQQEFDKAWNIQINS